MGLKSGGAEGEFETYSVIQDYETKKTAGAPEPPEPPSLAPMYISSTLLCQKFENKSATDHTVKALIV